jgi:iron complex transport system permease protein
LTDIAAGTGFQGSASRKLVFAILILLILLLFIIDIFTGSVHIDIPDVFAAIFGKSGEIAGIIVLKFRLPKALTAVAAGAALSLSGLQMQTVFRNPMAGPYVLGISSGASLGVAFVIMGYSSGMTLAGISGAGNWFLAGAAWAGAAAVMILMLVISARVRDIMTILIIGIMLSGGISAVVSIMQYFSNETLLKAYMIWTMGSLGNLKSSQLQVMLISVLAGIVLSAGSVKMLNALLLGENYARSMGLDIKSARILVFACTSILTGSITAFCGPIGFIGIAVPHIARLIFRTSDHRVLVPGTILGGGAIMLISDIISQLPGSETVLPLNSVTSLIGIPVVIWVIFRNRKYSGI